MGFKFVVTGQIIPHEIGDEVEFDEMPPQGMLHRLRPVDSELVAATPQAEESEPEAEKPTRGKR